jgi:branched-chain amino acid transport system ATP-binding protein
MTDVLTVRSVDSWYGRSQALWDIELTVRAGEGMGVVGRNGAGKSTLLRSISRVHGDSRGTIELTGKPLARTPAHAVARMGLSFVREGAPVIGDLSVLSNLDLAKRLARLRGQMPVPYEEVWEIFPVLSSKQGLRAGLLSGGQRQMLALASAIVSRPTILLLDEPSAGLAPEACASIFAAIRKLCDQGLAVLIAEQNRDWLDGVADRSVLLESGRLHRDTGSVA